MNFNQTYSVIIRTKNSGRTIKRTLDSLLKQSHSPTQIIIVDSGSTDDTLSIVKKYNVLILYYPTNIPFNYSKAINIGVGNAVNKYILILSSHVEFLNKKSVHFMYKELHKSNKCIAVSLHRTNLKVKKVVNGSNDLNKEVIDMKSFQGKAMFNFCSFIRKSSWKEYPFNTSIPSCEDQDWSYYFIKKGFYSVIILDTLISYQNPYYNVNKDALDTFTIGKNVYPYFISFRYMYKMFKVGMKKIRTGKIESAKFNFLITWFILRYRFFGMYSKKSFYNKKLQ